MGTGHSRGATPISSKRWRLYPQPRCGQATRRTLSLSQVRRPCGPEYPIPITGDLRQDLLDCPTVPQRTLHAAAWTPFCPAPRGSIQPLLPALGSHSPQLALPVVMRLLAPVISSISMNFANNIICAGRRQGSPTNAHSRPSSGFGIIPRPDRSSSRTCACTRVIAAQHCPPRFLGSRVWLSRILWPSIDIYGRKWYKPVEIPMCITRTHTSDAKSRCGGDSGLVVF